MALYELHLTHKKQTKANDCWYAGIQMLKTWDNGGLKTKPTGKHTAHLHRGLLGHKLQMDSAKSKHFSFVLAENGLKTLPRAEFRVVVVSMVLACLQKYGPILIGGGFGELGPFKGLGHIIVVAGADTTLSLVKIYDPDKSDGAWLPSGLVAAKWWNDDESAVVLDNA